MHYVFPLAATQQESILTHRVLGYMKRTAPASAAANWTVDRDAQEILNLVFIPCMRWGRGDRARSTAFSVLPSATHHAPRVLCWLKSGEREVL